LTVNLNIYRIKYKLDYKELERIIFNSTKTQIKIVKKEIWKKIMAKKQRRHVTANRYLSKGKLLMLALSCQ